MDAPIITQNEPTDVVKLRQQPQDGKKHAAVLLAGQPGEVCGQQGDGGDQGELNCF